MSTSFHAPTIPYTPIDAVNRRAAALGSPGYAMATAYADYNGHRVSVSWNSYRGYYVAQYYWGERVVLARGNFRDCIDAAMRYYRCGALGATVIVSIRPGDEVAASVCRETSELVEGEEGNLPWLTWRHKVAAGSVRDYANPGIPRIILDWDLLDASGSEAEYTEALRARHGRTHA